MVDDGRRTVLFLPKKSNRSVTGSLSISFEAARTKKTQTNAVREKRQPATTSFPFDGPLHVDDGDPMVDDDRGDPRRSGQCVVASCAISLQFVAQFASRFGWVRFAVVVDVVDRSDRSDTRLSLSATSEKERRLFF